METLTNPDIDKDLSYMVSNFDIMKKTKHKAWTKVMKYNELFKYNDLLDILNRDICTCFILVQTSDTSGHWTVISRYRNSIYYFDSYGVKVDSELSNIPANERYKLHEDGKKLSSLIEHLNPTFRFYTNKIQFQAYSNPEGKIQVNTCGKHCLVFSNAVMSGIPMTQYNQKMSKLSKTKKMTYDEIVTYLYNEKHAKI